MARKSRQLVDRAYDAWNRRDFAALESLIHPDVVLVQDSAIPGAEVVEGRDELRRWLEAFAETWESFRLTAEETIEVGDRIAVIVRVKATGKVSGVELDARVGHLVTAVDGRVLRWQTFNDPQEALEAVGLSE